MFNDIIEVLQNEIRLHIENGHLSTEQFDRYIDYLVMLKKNQAENALHMAREVARHG